ncbi:Mss4-like protein [Immersiella caudata]|uniref:Mss4-like protein n=1 Tax=Immersiella caudata TaxID=314043 RepID=A0AA40CCI2_9PEZI|nr:Mss4-like protein [Immersiella caudata]
MITISCLCGAAQQTVFPPPHHPHSWPTVNFCHCDSCRYLSGQLYTTYTPITQPSLAGLTIYSSSGTSTRYFCSTCGCHIFRYSQANGWEIATGAITSSPPLNNPPEIQHQHIPSDGGLSIWLPKSSPSSTHPKPSLPQSTPSNSSPTLSASCHCSRITFTITRPSRESTLPHSNYADLLIPYRDNPPSTLHTETDEELSQYKYLAGTCACRSCRLASGFEIQTWTFVPRVNMLMNIPSWAGNGSSSDADAAKMTLPLDFSALPQGLLKSYRSSAAAVREFCPTCGATVFWHDFERPDLIDVSVGLLRCPSGARAEPFLHWWTDRTSFSEESRAGRSGGIADWAEHLINNLEAGMRDA